MEEEETNRLKKAKEKERHRRKNDCRENLIVSKLVYVVSKGRKIKAMRTNGLRYLRWGGDGEAVQPEK